jgi:hypothetical protein
MPVGDLVASGDLITFQKMNSKLESVENADVLSNAAIAESKLDLDYSTSDLNQAIQSLVISGSGETMVSESKLGSNCSGSTGDKNRQLTLANTPITIVSIVIDGAFLYPTYDYTLNTNILTFLNSLWDDQKILVAYSK